MLQQLLLRGQQRLVQMVDPYLIVSRMACVRACIESKRE